MSPKRREILRMVNEGKDYEQIRKKLGMSKANIYTTVYQMRQQGIRVEPFQPKPCLSPRQRQVLRLYAEGHVVAQIAQTMGISPNTVWNHASTGFKRLGFDVPGQNRLIQLQQWLAANPDETTMADPFFS